MNQQPTVAFHTLGCKLNFAETSTIARQLKDHGFSKVDFEEQADVYVINTCSVTENADRECRAIVRKAMNSNPTAFIAVTGCYAQLKPAEIANIEGVDLVLGATEKFNMPKYLQHLQKKEHAEVHSCEIQQADFYVSSYSIGDRTRAFLKIQDGCDYSCSYCTIPLARGASRSDTIQNVIKQVYEIAERGVKEIVLTGVNTGDFNKDGKDFLYLIRELDALPLPIERFRISSIEPNLLTDEIIDFVASSEKFVPHFHIPLQSGSDKILKLMRRRYLSDLYIDRVSKIKSVMPHCSIGVDVIVGFPSETEEDFLETYNFLNKLDVSYLHVFTYSERDNTEALKIKEAIPVAERRKRNKMLRILSEKKQRHFYEQHVGKTYPVLFERGNEDGTMHAFTKNYIKVKVPYEASLFNQLVDVQLNSIDVDGLMTVDILDPSVANRQLSIIN